MKTRQAILVQPGRFEIRDMDLTVGRDQLLIRVAVCGLCNWELNHWRGTIGQCPQSLGHEVAGIVEQIGEGAQRFKVGDAVTALPPQLSGFADYCILSDADTAKLAPNADVRAALGEPLSCVITTLLAAEPAVGDVGVIVGAGPMGLWCTQLLAGRLLSALVVIDVNPARLALARQFGATHTIDASQQDAVAVLAEITEGRLGDFVIEGTGRPATLASACTYLRNTGRGRLILMSSHEAAGPAFDWRPLQQKGAIVKMTFPVSAVAPRDSFRRAVDMYNRGSLQVAPLITHRFDLAHIQQAFETLESKPNDYIKGVVMPYLDASA